MAIETLESSIRLNDPHFHTFEADAVFARLRAHDPVHWYAPLNTWILTKYDDVRKVSRDADHFTVTRGIRLDDAQVDMSFTDGENGIFAAGGEFIAFVDPPRHTDLRRILAPAFTARAVTAREARIRALAAALADEVPSGETVEWVSRAARLPILVALDLLGLPADDADDVRRWSDAVERLSDPATPEELAEIYAQFAPLTDYLMNQIERKRSLPESDDLMSLLLRSELDGSALSMANVVTFLQTVLAAGNDTMRSLLSGMVITLAEHPDQLRAIREDRSLVGPAVEECLRWITPARGFIRTATQPVSLRGREIEPGQHVYLAYDSANRDEEIFSNPDVFDIAAERPQQAAFGFGTHVCIGAAYARVEAVGLLDRLLDRFSSFTLVAEPERVVSVLRSGWRQADVIFR
jgi:cytochrome P450